MSFMQESVIWLLTRVGLCVGTRVGGVGDPVGADVGALRIPVEARLDMTTTMTTA